MTTPTSPTPPPQMWPEELRDRLAEWLCNRFGYRYPFWANLTVDDERKRTWLKAADALLASNILPPASGPTADAIFDRIKHGDEKHQAWLREELDKCWADPALVATMPTRDHLADLIYAATDEWSLLPKLERTERCAVHVADAILALFPTSTGAKPEPERAVLTEDDTWTLARAAAIRVTYNRIGWDADVVWLCDTVEHLTDRKV